MSRDPQLKAMRNKAIKEAYERLEAEKVLNYRGVPVQKYSRDAILSKLEIRFFLSKETISDILIAPDEESEDNQLNLFDPQK